MGSIFFVVKIPYDVWTRHNLVRFDDSTGRGVYLAKITNRWLSLHRIFIVRHCILQLLLHSGTTEKKLKLFGLIPESNLQELCLALLGSSIEGLHYSLSLAPLLVRSEALELTHSFQSRSVNRHLLLHLCVDVAIVFLWFLHGWWAILGIEDLVGAVKVAYHHQHPFLVGITFSQVLFQLVNLRTKLFMLDIVRQDLQEDISYDIFRRRIEPHHY